MEKGLLSFADGQRLKDPTASKSETVYVGPGSDREELLFCILFYLWRNGLVRLHDSNAQKGEWKFIRKFVRTRDDALALEVVARLKNPYTYAERAGGVRAYAARVKYVLSIPERSAGGPLPEEGTAGASDELDGSEEEANEFANEQTVTVLPPIRASAEGCYFNS